MEYFLLANLFKYSASHPILTSIYEVVVANSILPFKKLNLENHKRAVLYPVCKYENQTQVF